MQTHELKELIQEHKNIFVHKKNLITRDIQHDTVSLLQAKESIVITGIRRSGKSSLMRLLLDHIATTLHVPLSNMLYINFDDERCIDFTVHDFRALYDAYLELENPDPHHKQYIFLDEIQLIPQWERWIHRMYEHDHIKFIVTGSNASMLSKDIATVLTGRYRPITAWPFSFREFVRLKGMHVTEKDFFSREKKITLKKLFTTYYTLGGFPEVLKQNDASMNEQYFKDIVYRDILARHKIRNTKELKELCLYLISNVSTTQSYESLKKAIHATSINTIKNYVEILEDVFLFYKVPLFDYSVRRQIYNPGKFYTADIGFVHALAFRFSKNKGRMYENMVFTELQRRNKDVYYWKSTKGNEVDFVIRKGRDIEEAIQVCYTLHDERTKQRELASLYAIEKELRPRKYTLICDDEEGEETIHRKKITIIPLWKWLLQGT